MKKHTSSDAVLGINVTQTSVEAVLLRRVGDRPQVVHRIVRPRLRQGEAVGAGNYSTALPGLKSSDESDFTIEIGDGSNLGSDSLEAGLSGLETRTLEDKAAAHAASTGLVPFDAQLKDILNECSALGYPQPELAFCIGAPDVSYVELTVPAAREGKAAEQQSRNKRKAPVAPSVDRQRLLKLLEEKQGHPPDKERVAFLPMTPSEGQVRYLALVPAGDDAVTATLKRLHAQPSASVPSVRLLETEVSLYGHLFGQHGAADPKENTVLVRVGTEDTLLQVFAGEELLYCERLRSLTIYDAPETVCSRVMLQQDEHKLGTFHRVLVQGSGGRDERLIEGFQDFYPDAAVEPLAKGLLGEALGAEAEEGAGGRAGATAAAGVALRLLEAGAGPGVNMLPHRLQRRRRRLSVAWHTVAMLLVLIGVSVFFTWRYMEGQEQLQAYRAEMQQDPIETPEVPPAVLKARVDSLQAVHVRYTHALGVLDSLLMGSDRWSRTLEATSRATADLGNVWFSGWKPEGQNFRVDGFALSRSNIARLGRRLNATIERVEYDQVKTPASDVRVYPFTIVAPVPVEMPHVAEYLQDVAAGHIVQSDAEWRQVNASGHDPGHAPGLDHDH